MTTTDVNANISFSAISLRLHLRQYVRPRHKSHELQLIGPRTQTIIAASSLAFVRSSRAP